MKRGSISPTGKRRFPRRSLRGTVRRRTRDIGQIALRLNEDGEISNRYLWGPAVDQILADEQVEWNAGAQDYDIEQILWPLTDHQGTVRDLAAVNAISGDTEIVNTYRYNAYGILLAETDATVDHLFGFIGRVNQTDAGLINCLNRWYDPVIASWTTQDPITFQGGDANLYRYCGNDPVNSVDPSGLEEDGYGPHWFDNDWTDWWNPVAYIAAHGHSLGERIGLGWYTAGHFLDDLDLQPRAERQKKIVEDLSDPRSTSDVGDLAGERLKGISNAANVITRDCAQVHDGAVATVELGSEVAVIGKVGAGVVVKSGSTGVSSTVAGRFPSVGAARPNARIFQTGCNKLLPGTARQLNETFGKNLHSREWGRALERLKKANGLAKNHHGIIDELGNYYDDAGNLLDNIGDWLP